MTDWVTPNFEGVIWFLRPARGSGGEVPSSSVLEGRSSMAFISTGSDETSPLDNKYWNSWKTEWTNDIIFQNQYTEHWNLLKNFLQLLPARKYMWATSCHANVHRLNKQSKLWIGVNYNNQKKTYLRQKYSDMLFIIFQAVIGAKPGRKNRREFWKLSENKHKTITVVMHNMKVRPV